MKNRIQHWRSTITGLLIGIAFFILMWFEKIEADTLHVLIGAIPVVMGVIYKSKSK